jgi:Tol biopolymer transport system component
MTRHRIRRVLLCLAAAAIVAVTGPAPAAAAGSTDSEAPSRAPAHWLPPEAWVYNHWLPYDESRLYRLLRITRSDLWQQLRDDRRTVAQLAARRGWRNPRRLAAALVAPRARQVGRRRLRILESRALRTLTQGHLAQHVFFHSLHQFAVPSAAPDIFGVTDMEFRALRRSELSPLDIGRLNGRSPGRVLAQCAAVLRERVRAGVRGKAMTARQGRILLRRQLSQLPRWLGQQRYNGPPQTHRGAVVDRPRDYAANPVISASGTHVAFEAYEQKVPVAVRRGEISVVVRDLSTGAGTPAGPPDSVCTAPSSSYNPSISGDGRRLAFECSEGNLNFAKRYGQIAVFVRDVPSGDTQRIGVAPGDTRSVSRSFFSPAISADGRVLAFGHVRRSGRTAVLVRDIASGATTTAAGHLPADALEPSISADGRLVAFTSIPRSGAASQVYAYDVATGATTLVSRATGVDGAAAAGFASSPSVSADGRFVAFTSAARNLVHPRPRSRRARIYVRDMATGTTHVVPTPRGAVALDPAISADGAVVAYAAVTTGRPRVLVHDLRSGITHVASRASGASGAEADGAALSPSISGDGTRVAFASTATNLSPHKRNDTRAVFVRDLAAATTTLVSHAAGSR